MRFYIYTAIVWVSAIVILQEGGAFGTYYNGYSYVPYNIFESSISDWNWTILLVYLFIAFCITFGAKWFLEYLQKSKLIGKDKAED